MLAGDSKRSEHNLRLVRKAPHRIRFRNLFMIVIFQHTGLRRYAVRVKRPQQVDLVMDPAPGYDPLIPHDMLHLVVEAQLGLEHGIFGQLAAGGTAGTFHPIADGNISARAGARLRRGAQRRGKKLLRDGRDDGILSERATYICWHEWLSRSASGDRRKTSQSMTGTANHLKNIAHREKMHELNEKKIEQICRSLDDLSAHWSRLAVGDSITVSWPDLAVSSTWANSAAS